MPSVNSSSVSSVFDSSTVMTPSWPILVSAWPISSPMVASWAEMVPTWAMACSPSTGMAEESSAASLTAATAASIPRLSEVGLAPAATLLAGRC